MHVMTRATRSHGHLSRHERLKLARAEAFSRRVGTDSLGVPQVNLSGSELEVIDRLVRLDRTAVSGALLAVAGIGSGEVMRGVVLARVGEAARGAKAQGAISSRRAAQIARHVKRAQRNQVTLAGLR